METKRIFEEVHVGNFHGQTGSNRFPPQDVTNPPPRVAEWRSNLVALSHDFNLYFAAYGDKLHITIPRDLHQTLPAVPDLILELPQTAKGADIPGSLDRAHPHDVNNMKIGMLGDFEILLLGCDDGDVIAWYTRLLEREVRLADPASGTAPRSAIMPFFHENVGISAWGLAIHQVSRLIAVGSNFREVTIFKPALSAGYDPRNGSRCYREDVYITDSLCRNAGSASVLNPSNRREVFEPFANLEFEHDDGGFFELLNVKMVIRLGPTGHNIPSIDFLSDDRGEACTVMAIDINGKLWFLKLSTGRAIQSPPIHEPPNDLSDSDDDELEFRGWGVMCIPVEFFMFVQTPQHAIGMPRLKDALKLNTRSQHHCLQSIEITPSIDDVIDTSPIHPPPYYGSDPSPLLKLEPSDAESDHRSRVQMGVVMDERQFVLHLLREYKLNKYMLTRPTNLSYLTEENWIQNMIRILESDSWSYDVRIKQWVDEIDTLVKAQWDGGGPIQPDMRVLQFFLKLPTDIRYRFSNWNDLELATMVHIVPSAPPGAPAKQVPTDLRAEDGRTAIIRTSKYDIELLPPDPRMISTICRGFSQQQIENSQIEAFLDNRDRLNMFSVIPELSLLVVASQKGRAGLFTLTRLKDSFSEKISPVLMFRLDRILPLDIHEREFRPLNQLLGMAVAPLQGKGADGGVQRKIWRLVLQYMDHSVISYELKRDEGDGLVVF